MILRRALDTYVTLLGRLVDDEAVQQEMHALREAAKGRGSARSATEARARLEAAGERPVAFLDVLHSPEQRRQVAELNAALEVRCGHE